MVVNSLGVERPLQYHRMTTRTFPSASRYMTATKYEPPIFCDELERRRSHPPKNGLAWYMTIQRRDWPRRGLLRLLHKIPPCYCISSSTNKHPSIKQWPPTTDHRLRAGVEVMLVAYSWRMKHRRLQMSQRWIPARDNVRRARGSKSHWTVSLP